MKRIFQFQRLPLRSRLAITSMAAVAITMLVATYRSDALDFGLRMAASNHDSTILLPHEP